MAGTEKRSCFVIAPIGDEGSDTRKRSDKVLTHVFEAALSDEYKLTRADKISQPGMITSQILQSVQDSDLVIADLSEHNPNVFYELAVRHAVEKPIIHVTDPNWKIPFDVAGFRTIVFDFTDLDSVASAIKQLKEQAKETQTGNWGETPIKLANIMRRTTGDTPETLLLKQAVEGIAEISAKLSNPGPSVPPIAEVFTGGSFGTGKSSSVPLSTLRRATPDFDGALVAAVEGEKARQELVTHYLRELLIAEGKHQKENAEAEKKKK